MPTYFVSPGKRLRLDFRLIVGTRVFKLITAEGVWVLTTYYYLCKVNAMSTFYVYCLHPSLMGDFSPNMYKHLQSLAR